MKAKKGLATPLLDGIDFCFCLWYIECMNVNTKYNLQEIGLFVLAVVIMIGFWWAVISLVSTNDGTGISDSNDRYSIW
jgi:hypothetical protein